MGAPPDHWGSYLTTGPVDVEWDNTPGEALAGNARALITVSATSERTDQTTFSAPMRVDGGATYSGSVRLKAVTGATSHVVTLGAMTASTSTACFVGSPAATAFTLATVTVPGAAYQFVPAPLTVPSAHGYTRLTAAPRPQLAMPSPSRSTRPASSSG